MILLPIENNEVIYHCYTAITKLLMYLYEKHSVKTRQIQQQR